MKQPVELSYIKYVGRKASKSDTAIPLSGRFWSRPGAVVLVPVAEKHRYIAFGDIWTEISEAEHLASLTQSDLPSEASAVDKICEMVQALEMRDSLSRVVEVATSKLSTMADAPPADAAPPQAEKMAASARQKSAEDKARAKAERESAQGRIARMTLIKSAIQNLDLNDLDVAVGKFPNLDKLHNEMAGAPQPTIDEVTEALKELKIDFTPPRLRDMRADPAAAERRELAQMALGDLEEVKDMETMIKMATAFNIAIPPDADEGELKALLLHDISIIAGLTN